MKMILFTALYMDNMETNTTIPNIEATESPTFDVMMILQMVIASVGIIANITVVFAFLNHEHLRRKIPNMFIINQVNGGVCSFNFHLIFAFIFKRMGSDIWR